MLRRVIPSSVGVARSLSLANAANATSSFHFATSTSATTTTTTSFFRRQSTTRTAAAVPYSVPNHFNVDIKDIGRCQNLIDDALSVHSLRKDAAALRRYMEQRQQLFDTLTKQKTEMDSKADKHPVILSWATFVALTVQFVVLFKWVFFDFDWNLVEPVTYFLGYSSCVTMALMFYNSTGKDFTYDALWARLSDGKRQRLYKKANFDLEAYTKLETELESLKKTLSITELD